MDIIASSSHSEINSAYKLVSFYVTINKQSPLRYALIYDCSIMFKDHASAFPIPLNVINISICQLGHNDDDHKDKVGVFQE